MARRASDLQHLIDAAQVAVAANGLAASEPRTAAARIFAALAATSGTSVPAVGERPAVTAQLQPAIDAARRSTRSEVVALADALAAIEGRLAWRPRAGAEQVGAAFAGGHANAYLVGPRGLEVRTDVWLGFSLLAPGIVYPDHSHPPEEVYVALSAGAWRQRADAWFEPGIGGGVYNPPGIVHAMRAGNRPLLAMWCLWTGAA